MLGVVYLNGSPENLQVFCNIYFDFEKDKFMILVDFAQIYDDLMCMFR